MVAVGIAWAVMPREAPPREGPPAGVLDVRPVLRSRAAMAWIAGYAAHTWELAALRAWGVTFLAAAIAWHGAPAWLPGPNILFTAAGLLGILVSFTGNEMAQRLGRARVVGVAMAGWALAFGHLCIVTLGGCLALRWLGRGG